METIITLNWWSLRRALCTLLIGIAALWAMPRSAHAQFPGIIGEYNATTGAAINANFITGVDKSFPVLVSLGTAINAKFITGWIKAFPYWFL